jgi:voltage-gated potassium channel
MDRVRRRLSDIFFSSPTLRRLVWHGRRVSRSLDRRFVVRAVRVIVVFVLLAAVIVWLVEKDRTIAALADCVYWAFTTVLGQGQASFVVSPIGRLLSWTLIIFGVAIFGTITGALVALVIDFLIKEGQGLGASGYRDHVVVCGWNATARDLIDELRTDAYHVKVVVLADMDKNPAGEGVYFVRGDSTSVEALERAGIKEAAAALIFPKEPTDDADMHSILTVMAVESIAPGVRTVAEVNNPRHVDHFRRAEVDEILVTSRLASRLLARSALFPGLSELVTDIVSGGTGSELYRVALPADFVGLSIDAASARLRSDHRATLLSVNRGGQAFVNPPTDFALQLGDDAIVVAESLGALAPLEIREVTDIPRTAAVVPSA